MKAAIFGLGGVVVDSEDHWHDLQMEYFKEIIPTWSEKDMASTIGIDLTSLHHLLMRKDAHVTMEELKAKYDELDELVYTKKCHLVAGLLDLVTMLKKHNIKCAVATSTRKKNLGAVRERFNLDKYFDEFVCTEDVWASKPHPNIYLHTATQLGVSPTEVVVVDDADHGIMAAKEAGMPCIALRGTAGQELSEAQVVVDSLTEITPEMVDDPWHALKDLPKSS